MSRRKNPRCEACGVRVRRNQPYVIAVSRETGKETYYHCRPECQEQGTKRTLARLEAEAERLCENQATRLRGD